MLGIFVVNPKILNLPHFDQKHLHIATCMATIDGIRFFGNFSAFGRFFLGGGFKHFYFHPYLGQWSNLTNIFQMGWNHRPVFVDEKLCSSSLEIPLLLQGQASEKQPKKRPNTSQSIAQNMSIFSNSIFIHDILPNSSQFFGNSWRFKIPILQCFSLRPEKDYWEMALNATKADFPFETWRANLSGGQWPRVRSLEDHPRTCKW